MAWDINPDVYISQEVGIIIDEGLDLCGFKTILRHVLNDQFSWFIYIISLPSHIYIYIYIERERERERERKRERVSHSSTNSQNHVIILKTGNRIYDVAYLETIPGM